VVAAAGEAVVAEGVVPEVAGAVEEAAVEAADAATRFSAPRAAAATDLSAGELLSSSEPKLAAARVARVAVASFLAGCPAVVLPAAVRR
jgi:hypothetical protein